MAAKSKTIPLAQSVVDKWRAWDMAPKSDGFEWHQFEAALIALESELAQHRRMAKRLASEERQLKGD